MQVKAYNIALFEWYIVMKNFWEIEVPKNKWGQEDNQQRDERFPNENYCFVLSSKFLMSSAAE